MPEDTRITSENGRAQPEILDLIPRLRLLPGENVIGFEHLRQAFLLDLAPSTPYQTALAENIVVLEWEIHRYRSMRDSLIRSRHRQVALGTRVLESANILNLPATSTVSAEIKAFANALMSPDSEGYAAALDWLEQHNIDLGELIAAAYQEARTALEPLERILAELEIRRHRLREDYDRLQSARARPIEDATLLEGE